ncbi:hypothetical protein D3C77_613450 [compost metagenome]
MGALLVLPCAFIFTKAGDSCMLMRIQVEIANNTIDNRNGRRHPQTSNWSPLI